LIGYSTQIAHRSGKSVLGTKCHSHYTAWRSCTSLPQHPVEWLAP